MRLSIVVPAYNEQDYLRACLEQIMAEVRRCADPDQVEVLVVDNASVDATAEVARSIPGVRLVHEPIKGLTQARQTGMEAATGELIGYVDADTRMPPGWIVRVLRTFDLYPGVVCVSGPYIYYDAARWQRAMVWLYWVLLGHTQLSTTQRYAHHAPQRHLATAAAATLAGAWMPRMRPRQRLPEGRGGDCRSGLPSPPCMVPSGAAHHHPIFLPRLPNRAPYSCWG